jgi:hypothetical protein
MKAVWKYDIKISDEFVIELPRGAEILTCSTQGIKPVFWALGDTDNHVEKSVYHFRLCGTDHPIEQRSLKYIDTFFVEDLVFHLFLIGVDL